MYVCMYVCMPIKFKEHFQKLELLKGWQTLPLGGNNASESEEGTGKQRGP
jgi:hypothetical protein